MMIALALTASDQSRRLSAVKLVPNVLNRNVTDRLVPFGIKGHRVIQRLILAANWARYQLRLMNQSAIGPI